MELSLALFQVEVWKTNLITGMSWLFNCAAVLHKNVSLAV
jgi:hypothetical protein